MAKKPTYSPVTDREANANEINSALDAVNEGFSNTLSLDGSTPNAMNADLDMNSNDILNTKEIDVETFKVNGVVITPDVAALDAPAVKTAYESNANTNAFTDADEAKLDQVMVQFDTVAALLADTGTYSVGTYVHVKDGDHTYKVVASSGHVQNSATTPVEFDVLPSQDGAFEIRAAVESGADASGFLTSLATAGVAAIRFSGIDSVKIGAAVTFTNPVKVYGDGVCKIIPSLGLAGGNMLSFATDDVTVDGLVLDPTGETMTPATGNTRLIFGGDGATKYRNHRYTNNKIINANFSDGNSGATNLIVTHGFYIDNVDDVHIAGNDVDSISGAACFMRDCHNFTIERNLFEGTRWYTVQIVEGCVGWTVQRNRFNGNDAEGVYWGGAINTVSDAGETKQEDGLIAHNEYAGNYAYGGVIRIQSSDNVIVEHNKLLSGIGLGTLGAGNTLTGIRVVTRGTSSLSKNEPCQGAVIRHNTLYGPSAGAKRLAIYCSNDWHTTRNPMRNLWIYGNRILSEDTSNYWGEGIVVHGLDGGVEDVYVFDNYVQIYSQSGPTVGGAIGFTANDADGKIDRVHLGGNTCVDIGTPASSYQTGVSIGAYVDNVINERPNSIDNLFYGVRTFTNSGPTLEGLDRQDWGTNTTDTLFQQDLSRYDVPLEGSKTYDPPSLTSGSTTFTDVTVTGAALGDLVDVSFSLNQDGVIFTGYVRVANSVRVYIENKDTATKDLGSGNLTVKVRRQ